MNSIKVIFLAFVLNLCLILTASSGGTTQGMTKISEQLSAMEVWHVQFDNPSNRPECNQSSNGGTPSCLFWNIAGVVLNVMETMFNMLLIFGFFVFLFTSMVIQASFTTVGIVFSSSSSPIERVLGALGCILITFLNIVMISELKAVLIDRKPAASG